MTISELDQSKADGFVVVELRGRSAKTVNNRLAILSTLIKYVTGNKSKLRFKIAGMAGDLAPVPWPDVERSLVAADLWGRAVDVSEDDKRDAIATVFGAFGRQRCRDRVGEGDLRRRKVVTHWDLNPGAGLPLGEEK